MDGTGHFSVNSASFVSVAAAKQALIDAGNESHSKHAYFTVTLMYGRGFQLKQLTLVGEFI